MYRRPHRSNRITGNRTLEEGRFSSTDERQSGSYGAVESAEYGYRYDAETTTATTDAATTTDATTTQATTATTNATETALAEERWISWDSGAVLIDDEMFQ